MTARIDTIGFNELAPTIRSLGDAGGTVDDADWLRKPGNASDTIAFIRERQGYATSRPGANPFAVPVETLIERLRQANQAQGWSIKRKDIDALAKTAPSLPEGRLAFLSFRIRFGEGQKGVEQTANAHIAEIIRVHGEQGVWRWDYLRTDKKHLRLLVGNETQKPALEWCVIDLDAHRKRQSITAVRGPKSIADEGLVLAWLYANPRVDYKYNPGLFLAGYELNVPEHDDEPWQFVPIVLRRLEDGEFYLFALWRSRDYSAGSVPSLRE